MTLFESICTALALPPDDVAEFRRVGEEVFLKVRGPWRRDPARLAVVCATEGLPVVHVEHEDGTSMIVNPR